MTCNGITTTKELVDNITEFISIQMKEGDIDAAMYANNTLIDTLQKNTDIATLFEVNTKSKAKLDTVLLKDEYADVGNKKVISNFIKAIATAIHNVNVVKHFDVTYSKTDIVSKKTKESGVPLVYDTKTKDTILSRYKGKTSTDLSEGWQQVLSLLLLKMKDNEDIDTNVKKAITAVGLEWISNGMLEDTANSRDISEVKKLLGLDKNTNISPTESAFTGYVDGMLASSVSEIGGKLYTLLGLKAVSSNDTINTEIVEDAFKKELGMLVISAIEQSGYIKVSETYHPSELYNYAFGTDDTTNRDAIISILQNKDLSSYEKDNRILALNLDIPKVLTYNIVANPNIIKSIRDDSKIYASTFEKIENKDNKRGIFLDRDSAIPSSKEVRNKGVTGYLKDSISEEHIKAVQKQSGTANYFRTPFVQFVKRKKDMLRKKLGYIDLDKTFVLEVNKPAIRGKNNMIDKSIKDLLAAHTYAGNRAMYAKWSVITNNRFMIDSNELNWQDKKLHRYSVHRGLSEVTDKNINAFKLILAQSFDMDIDKTTAKAILSGKESIDNAIADILENSGYNKVLKDRLSKYGSLEDYQGSEDYFNDTEAVFDYVTNKYNSSEVEHALSGSIELLSYTFATANKEPYSTGAMLETDAITSGYAIRGMQMPIHNYLDNPTNKEYIWSELERVGIMRKDSKFKSYGERAKSKSSKDSYEAPAATMSNKLGTLLKNTKKVSTVTGVNTADVKKSITTMIKLLDPKSKVEGTKIQLSRSFMKDPFMVLNYGSAINSIVRSAVNRSIEEFYKEVEYVAKANHYLTTKKLSKEKRDYIIKKRDDKVKELMGIFESGYIEKYNNETKTMDTLAVVADTTTKKGKVFSRKSKLEAIHKRLINADKNFVLNEYETRYISNAIKTIVQKPITETFEEKYGTFIDITKRTNRLFDFQFKLANEVLTEEELKTYNEKLKRRGLANFAAPLTSTEYKNSIQEIEDILPTFHTPLKTKEGKYSKGLLASKNKISSKDAIGNISSNAMLRKDSTTIWHTATDTYRLGEAYTQGAVLPIHFFDGSIQAKVLSKYKALGVHDANYAGINDIFDVTMDYNKEFYELNKHYNLLKEVIDSTLLSINTLAEMYKDNPERLTEILKEVNSKYTTEGYGVTNSSISSLDFNSIDLKEASSLLKVDPIEDMNVIEDATLLATAYSDIKVMLKYFKASEEFRKDLYTSPVSVQQAYYDEGGSKGVAEYVPENLEYKKQAIDEKALEVFEEVLQNADINVAIDMLIENNKNDNKTTDTKEVPKAEEDIISDVAEEVCNDGTSC